jgi:maltooligosyltrehalose trehalohydrolase
MISAWGPVIEGSNVRFRLWAPDRDVVHLELDARAPIAMSRDPEGWHEVMVVAAPGSRYGFHIGEMLVPDPASRAQLGTASLVPDPSSYVWRHDDWSGRPWEEAVIYELHVGLTGGFRAVADRLPALSKLGITAIELMPIAEFPGSRNWGYDGVLPFAPKQTYGTPDDLKFLVDEAHGQGMMVILDAVYNHFGPKGNYLPLFASGFFRSDRITPWGNAIDFDRVPVRQFFIENALYWRQEFRIDGLRLDAVHAIGDDSFVRELAETVHGFDPRMHLVVENENNDAGLLTAGFDAQWNDDFHHAVHVLLTGESWGYYADYADAPADSLARALSDGFIYQGQYAKYCGRNRGTDCRHLPPSSFVNFLQNHDHIGNRALGERLITLTDEDALRAAIALLVLSPGIPLIFMGEEAGAREPFLFFCDYRPDALADAVMEGRRREFSRFPEFSDPAKSAQIPDPNALETFERSRPKLDGPDADAWRSLYTALFALRREHIVPHLKQTNSLGARAIDDKAVLAAWQLGDRSRLTIASNLGGGTVDAAYPPSTPIWGAPPAGKLPPRTTLCWIEPL